MAEEEALLVTAFDLHNSLQKHQIALKSYSIVPLLQETSSFFVAENELGIDFKFAKKAFMAIRRLLLSSNQSDTKSEAEAQRLDGLTEVMLLIQPAFNTLWNNRKRALLALTGKATGTLEADENARLTACQHELAFSAFVLRNPIGVKCAEVYSHRRFVIERCVPTARRHEFLANEFSLLDQLSLACARNYVLFAHRAWLFDFCVQHTVVAADANFAHRSLSAGEVIRTEVLSEIFAAERGRIARLVEQHLLTESRVDFSVLHYVLTLIGYEFSTRSHSSEAVRYFSSSHGQINAATDSLAQSREWLRGELINERKYAEALCHGSLTLRNSAECREFFVSEAILAAITTYLRRLDLLERVAIEITETNSS